MARGPRSLRALLLNRYFWLGFAGLLVFGIFFYFLFNNLLMPAYTRHDVSVLIPPLENKTFEEARQILEQKNLGAEQMTQRFNPELPRDVVIDQNPPANTHVKPGRTIFLTVNTGQVPMITIPPLEGMSLREARNRIQAVGLRVAETRPDSVPSPYRNTITRQRPAAGDSLPQGSSVTLWYSTGLGDQYVVVPDVTGLSIEEARRRMIGMMLRSVVVGESEFEGLGDPVVVRQSREAGTRVREGFEIRLFVGEESELENDAEQ